VGGKQSPPGFPLNFYNLPNLLQSHAKLELFFVTLMSFKLELSFKRKMTTNFKIDLACNVYLYTILKKIVFDFTLHFEFVVYFYFLFQMGWRVALASLALLGLAAANDSGLFECPKGDILPRMTLKGSSHDLKGMSLLKEVKCHFYRVLYSSTL